MSNELNYYTRYEREFLILSLKELESLRSEIPLGYFLLQIYVEKTRTDQIINRDKFSYCCTFWSDISVNLYVLKSHILIKLVTHLWNGDIFVSLGFPRMKLNKGCEWDDGWCTEERLVSVSSFLVNPWCLVWLMCSKHFTVCESSLEYHSGKNLMQIMGDQRD